MCFVVAKSHKPLTEFKIVLWTSVQQLIQLRYQRGFAHWDHAGQIANHLLDLFPGLAVIEGSPAQVTMQHEEKQVQLRYGADGASVSSTMALGQSDFFYDFADPFLTLVLKVCNIATLTRVGHRTFFHHPMKSKSEVLEYIDELGRKNSAGGSFFANSEDARLSAKKLSAFTLIFEDEKLGVRLNVNASDSKISLNGPHAEHIRKHLPPASDVILTDVDVFTTKPLNTSDLLINEFCKSNLKMIKTRILPLLEL